MSGHTSGGWSLRPARADEARRLNELGRLGWETTYPWVLPHNREVYLSGAFWSLARLEALAGDADALLLAAADADDRAIGFASVELTDDGATELTRLYVDPGLRSGGVGAALFAAARDWSAARAARCMRINVFADNHAGRRFYERHGAVLTELCPFTLNEQVLDDAWYELPLAGADGHGPAHGHAEPDGRG